MPAEWEIEISHIEIVTWVSGRLREECRGKAVAVGQIAMRKDFSGISAIRTEGSHG